MALPSAQARTRHSDAWARERFADAERMREALNRHPPGERTRHDYQRVLNAYRLVYHGAPTSNKADPSVVAVAQTLVEMGRRFDDDKILREAIEQYRFLRHEYPGSKYRFEALFTIGEIYQDDLNDPEASRAAFQEFLRRYPHNHLADDARQAIVKLAQSTATTAADRQAPGNAPEDKTSAGEAVTGNYESSDEPARKQNDQLPNNQEAAKSEDANSEVATLRPGHLPRVTGIRHWSTPDYTRVAVDVESDVKFTSERISHPARIYFDLRDTRLASTLVGKSFNVEDGLLKEVRVAQFAPRRTRIVLEVDSLWDYDAFFLPNPSRLIVDIYGKDIWGKNAHAREHAGATPEASRLAKSDYKSEEDVTGNAPSVAPIETDVAENLESRNEELNRHAVTAGSELRLERPQQTGIVKRIVKADDDTGADTVPSSPAKHNSRGLQFAASKKSNSGDLESESTSVLTPSEMSQGNLNGLQDKTHPRKLASSNAGASDLIAREAKPTESGDRSLIRALGLKIGKIVIDPGHGGHDTGTIGPDGLAEKDLVLDVGRRLGRLLQTRLGAEVVYTRNDDTFIPLETRTAIANQARADLFISIHANSSRDAAARGVETYYLNFTSSRDALEVAARENAVSESSIYELQDLVKKIALKEKIEESREFAWDVQESLHSGLAAKSPAIRDRGVKKAPFIVLIGANMPSILAEISFVSNPTDERHLSTGEYRERIAECLYRGIAKYASGLSGVKVASKVEKDSRQ